MIKMNSVNIKELTLKKHMYNLLKRGISEGIFPCAASSISYGLGEERKTIVTNSGNAVIFPEKRNLKKGDYFDLASLTKPFATTMAILCLLKTGKIGIDEKLPSLVEKKTTDEKKGISLKQLLSHSSGFPAHREYFNILRDIPEKRKKERLLKLLLDEKIEYTPGTKSVYSDLGFMLLGEIIEKKEGCTLADFVENKVLQPFNMEEKIFFKPITAEKKKHMPPDFVATENCPWRKKILCGEVHDDNCYTMSGIAGHSGLFGNIEGVTAYTGLILDMWKGMKHHPNIENKDLKKFLIRQSNIPGSTWALGFDTPAESGSSSGSFFSARSAGHLGFTGTSFWIDPEKDIVVVLLTNRIHPHRENTKIRQFRPFFHDSVLQKLLNGT
jgi:CubicO group peptidase (beta-lactamase class C family)